MGELTAKGPRNGRAPNRGPRPRGPLDRPPPHKLERGARAALISRWTDGFKAFWRPQALLETSSEKDLGPETVRSLRITSDSPDGRVTGPFGESRNYRSAHSCGKNDPGIASASPKTTNSIASTLTDPSTSVTPSRGGFSAPFWNMMA